jgi:hypothetical protein
LINNTVQAQQVTSQDEQAARDGVVMVPAPPTWLAGSVDVPAMPLPGHRLPTMGG